MQFLLVLLIVSIGWPAYAETVSGIPVIADADTVEFLPRTKVRLLDMDAPETDQFCLDKKGEAYSCGITALEALKQHVRAKQWNCEGTKFDRDGRLLARCIVESENISQWMVRNGWAMSPTKKGYSHRFDADEKLARDAQAGLWSGAFIAPQDWRYRNCKTEVRGALDVPIDAERKLCGSPAIPPDPSCTIKSTTRAGACIYHVEGGSFYGALKMSDRNKRWFCSELEAQAAGCRRSKR